LGAGKEKKALFPTILQDSCCCPCSTRKSRQLV
jgi:hypothetical protein